MWFLVSSFEFRVKSPTERTGNSKLETRNYQIEVPDMGWLSIIEDPTGAALGLWQTKTS